MKKIIYFLSLILIISSATSCKKDKIEDSIIGSWKIEKYRYIDANGSVTSESNWHSDSNVYESFIQYTNNKEYCITYKNNGTSITKDWGSIYDIIIEGNSVKAVGDNRTFFYENYNYKFKDGKLIVYYKYNTSTFEVELTKTDKNIITEVESMK